MTEAERIAKGLTEAQREFLASLPPFTQEPARAEFLCAEIGQRNWGNVPSALVKLGCLTSRNDRQHDQNASAWYRATPLGLAVRKVLEAQEDGS